MGESKPHRSVLLIVGAFSNDLAALAAIRARVEAEWGTIVLESPLYDFDQTIYYEAEMGSELKKQFWALENLIEPEELAEIKQLTNGWEAEYADDNDRNDVLRPVNIDPGYLTEAKLVLATTKDRDHRIYLSQGIFAEVTLTYHRDGWQDSRWTYPDYCTAGYHDFFYECRQCLRERFREENVR
jgi:hypothetical protein